MPNLLHFRRVKLGMDAAWLRLPSAGAVAHPSVQSFGWRGDPRQLNVGGTVVRNIDDVYEAATKALDLFKSVVHAAARGCGMDPTGKVC